MDGGSRNGGTCEGESLTVPWIAFGLLKKARRGLTIVEVDCLKWDGDPRMVKRRKKAGRIAEGQHKETPIEFLSSLAGVLATGLFIITFVVQAFSIPSSSMENTLLVGDHVFVNRVQFAPQSS